MKRWRCGGIYQGVVIGTLVLAGCSLWKQEEKGPVGVAKLLPTQGHGVTGEVTFQQLGEHVVLTAKVSGLQPGQEHGFHVHEKGDCSSPDGSSAGGHFNPDGKPHGPQGGEHHAGDLPALKADAWGHAELQVHLHGVSVTPGPRSVVGRGLIVHMGSDDYLTQPSGNSGARVACGVIALQ